MAVACRLLLFALVLSFGAALSKDPSPPPRPHNTHRGNSRDSQEVSPPAPPPPPSLHRCETFVHGHCVNACSNLGNQSACFSGCFSGCVDAAESCWNGDCDGKLCHCHTQCQVDVAAPGAEQCHCHPVRESLHEMCLYSCAIQQKEEAKRGKRGRRGKRRKKRKGKKDAEKEAEKEEEEEERKVDDRGGSAAAAELVAVGKQQGMKECMFTCMRGLALDCGLGRPTSRHTGVRHLLDPPDRFCRACG